MKLQCTYCGINFNWYVKQLDTSIVSDMYEALKYDYEVICPHGCPVRLNEALSEKDLARYQ